MVLTHIGLIEIELSFGPNSTLTSALMGLLSYRVQTLFAFYSLVYFLKKRTSFMMVKTALGSTKQKKSFVSMVVEDYELKKLSLVLTQPETCLNN